MKHIQQIWNQYRLIAVHLDAPDDQITETRRAFYAGISMVPTYMSDKLSDEAEETLEDGQLMEEIADEIEAFGKDVVAGRM